MWNQGLVSGFPATMSRTHRSNARGPCRVSAREGYLGTYPQARCAGSNYNEEG